MTDREELLEVLAQTYSHVLGDETELAYERMLA